jgi:hypothetical protein
MNRLVLAILSLVWLRQRAVWLFRFISGSRRFTWP